MLPVNDQLCACALEVAAKTKATRVNHNLDSILLMMDESPFPIVQGSC